MLLHSLRQSTWTVCCSCSSPIYKGCLIQSRGRCKGILALKLSSNLLDLWSTFFPIPRTPYLCCWRVELYTGFHGRIIESLVFDRLSENWIVGSRNINDQLWGATLHPMLWLSIVGHYTIVWPKKTRLFSTNIATGFSAESWSLGSSTISLSSWIVRKDLYQNHTLSYKKPHSS